MFIKNWLDCVENNKELSVAIDIMNIIEDFGYESFIVGGFVRDLIMGVPSDDIDISSNINSEQLSKLFDIVDIGQSKSFGVHVIRYKNFIFEISQYRNDIYDQILGSGASSIESAQSFKDDASRRDLSINAFGCDKNGNVVDYFGGIDDINNKIIKTVGDPQKRFSEDYLRMLRAVRFSSRLGFDIDPDTLQAIKDNADKILNISNERIFKEISKMADQDGNRFADAIVMLDKSGLLKYVLPEVYAMKGLEHNVEHHPEGDVYQHTLSALRINTVADKILNMSILWHDIGKTITHTVGEDGGHHYYAHNVEGLDLINSVCDRLKIDNDTRDTLKFVCLNHMTIHDFPKVSKSKAMKLIEDKNWGVLLHSSYCDSKCRGDLFDVVEWNKIFDRVVSLKEWFKGKMAIDSIKKVVNGHMVMGLRPEIKPSKELGIIINTTIDWILDNSIDVESDIEQIKEFIMEQ